MTKPLPHRITFTREQAQDTIYCIDRMFEKNPEYPDENLRNVRDRLERLLKKMDKTE